MWTRGEGRLNLTFIAYGILFLTLLVFVMLAWSVGQVFLIFFGNGDKQKPPAVGDDANRSDL